MKITEKTLEQIIEQEISTFLSELEKGDIGYVEKFDSICTVYDVLEGGKKVKVKIGKTGKEMVLPASEVQMIPDDEEESATLDEKNVPTQPSKWNYYKNQAKKKFDVYPSAYANAWAAKKYKSAGGKWRTEEAVDGDQSSSSIEKDYYRIQNKLKSIENRQKKLMKPYFDARKNGDRETAKSFYQKLQKLKDIHLKIKEKLAQIEFQYFKKLK